MSKSITQRARQTQWYVERLADNRIGDEGARALGDALKTNTTLIELDLRCEQHHKKAQQGCKAHNGTWRGADNEIGDEGTCTLGDALKTNTTLARLSLSSEQQGQKEAQQKSKDITAPHV